MDPPIPVPEGIERIDPTLFVQLPTLFEKDTGTSEFDCQHPKVWNRRNPKPSYLIIVDDEEVEGNQGNEAGPSAPVVDPILSVDPSSTVPTVPVTQSTAPASATLPPRPESSQTVTQPTGSQPKRRLESSEGSRSARQRKQTPKRVRSGEETGAENERRKKAAFAARFNVVEQHRKAREERQAREANIFDMTVPAETQDPMAEDVLPSPPPTVAQATANIPPSEPSRTVPNVSKAGPSTTQNVQDPALQLVLKLMEKLERKEEEEKLRKAEEAQAKERRREEKERLRAEEMRRMEDIRREELRRMEEATQTELRRVEETRREEMRKEQEARYQFEAKMNESLKQTTNVLAALYEKITAERAVPISGPIPQTQQALPSRAGEGTSGTGTTVSDTPTTEDTNPPTQSRSIRSDKEGDSEATKTQSAD